MADSGGSKKRPPRRERQNAGHRSVAEPLNRSEFMSHVLDGGRRFRTFNMLDEGVRERRRSRSTLRSHPNASCACSNSLKLGAVCQERSAATTTSELDCAALVDWHQAHAVNCAISSWASRIRTPTSSASIASYRSEVLDAHLFEGLDQVREITAGWITSEATNDGRTNRSATCCRASSAVPSKPWKVLLTRWDVDGEGYDTNLFANESTVLVGHR